MSRNILLAILLVLAFGAIVVLMYDRYRLQHQCEILKQTEIELKKEVESEKRVWAEVYRDCVDENKTLIKKMKDLSVASKNRSSN
jgi:hypothetical protein